MLQAVVPNSGPQGIQLALQGLTDVACAELLLTLVTSPLREDCRIRLGFGCARSRCCRIEWPSNTTAAEHGLESTCMCCNAGLHVCWRSCCRMVQHRCANNAVSGIVVPKDTFCCALPFRLCDATAGGDVAARWTGYAGPRYACHFRHGHGHY